MSKFLDMGRGKYVYCVVNGYKVHISDDNLMFVAEATEELNGSFGYTDGDVDVNDLIQNRIVSQLELLLQTRSLSGKTVLQILDEVTQAAKSRDVLPIVDFPKIGKAGSEALKNEMFVYTILPDCVRFLTMGTRRGLYDYFTSVDTLLCGVSPIQYYYATNINSTMGYIRTDGIAIYHTDFCLVSPDRQYLSLAVGVNLLKHLNLRTE